MRRKYVIYRIGGYDVTARWTLRGARKYCRRNFNYFSWRYER